MKQAASEHRGDATVRARIEHAARSVLASAARRQAPGSLGVTRCVSPHRPVRRQ
jgi:hypothetical protein